MRIIGDVGDKDVVLTPIPLRPLNLPYPSQGSALSCLARERVLYVL